MNTLPVLVFPPSTELQVERGGVRAGLLLFFPAAGSALTEEISASQNSLAAAVSSEGEGKVQ
jgi:hypothetical protein